MKKNKTILGIFLVLCSMLMLKIVPLLIISGLKSLTMATTAGYLVSGFAGLTLLLNKEEN